MVMRSTKALLVGVSLVTLCAGKQALALPAQLGFCARLAVAIAGPQDPAWGVPDGAYTSASVDACSVLSGNGAWGTCYDNPGSATTAPASTPLQTTINRGVGSGYSYAGFQFQGSATVTGALTVTVGAQTTCNTPTRNANPSPTPQQSMTYATAVRTVTVAGYLTGGVLTAAPAGITINGNVAVTCGSSTTPFSQTIVSYTSATLTCGAGGCDGGTDAGRDAS
jgi:hypothetical protein